MSNHENKIQFESYLNDVKETVDTSSDEIRRSAISEGIGNLRSRIGKLDIQVNTELSKDVVEESNPRYKGTELADVAIDVYKNNIKEEEEPEKEVLNASETPCTKASRENAKATIRSLAGMRTNGGDEGKRAPNANMSGSGSTGGYGPSNVVVAPLSMEEYKSQIFKDFGLIEEEQGYEAIEEVIEEEYDELDLVSELETNLLELVDRSWVEVDRSTRQLCLEHGVLVKDINREFRSRHGVFPDKWIKEQVEVEQCGWIPLDEMSRINKVGQVYDVTFMFRGGTQRFKFFWPSAARPSRADMQLAVEKFYPKARLIAFYPSMDNDDNFMVVVPPMTENYEVIPESNWEEMSEELNEVYQMICEEEGEPTSPMFIEEDGSLTLYIEDYDTGEEREVTIAEGKKGLWDNIHAKRKRGEKPAKKGDKDYPKTLNVEGYKKRSEADHDYMNDAALRHDKKLRRELNPEADEDDLVDGKLSYEGDVITREIADARDNPIAYKHERKQQEIDNRRRGKEKRQRNESLDQARDNVGADKCWTGYKAKGTKKKNGKEVPNCVKEGTVSGMESSRKLRKDFRDKKYNAPKVPPKQEPVDKIASFSLERPLSNRMKEEFIPEGDEMKGMSQKSGDKRSTDSGAGMTAKGVAKYNRRTGGNLKTAVTTPPSKLKPGSKAAGRRKSFCARSRGWDGERGKAARRRWNC